MRRLAIAYYPIREYSERAALRFRRFRWFRVKWAQRNHNFRSSHFTKLQVKEKLQLEMGEKREEGEREEERGKRREGR
jgi:hypothetical protein